MFVLPELLKNLQGLFIPPVEQVVEREIFEVNNIHFILESTNNLRNLVNDVSMLCFEHGTTSSE